MIMEPAVCFNYNIYIDPVSGTDIYIIFNLCHKYIIYTQQVYYEDPVFMFTF